MITAENILIILIILLFLLYSFIIVIKVKSFYHPAVVLSFTWFLCYSLAIILIPGAPINFLSVIFIFICIFVFGTPVFFYKWVKVRQNFIKKKELRNNFINISRSHLFRKTLFIFSIMAIVFQLNFVIQNGYSLNEILFNTMNTAGAFVATRGNSGVEYGLVGMISTTATYFSSCIGGLIYKEKLTIINKIKIIFLSLAPSAIGVIILSSKLMLLISFIFFVSGIIINNIYYLKFRFSWLRIFKIIMLISLFVIPLILISIASREGFDSWEMIKFGLYSYSLGQVFAFSDFFTCYIGMSCTLNYDFGNSWLGKFTLTSLVEIFGYEFDLPPGTYQESLGYNDVFSTNVYTIFRGLILDFGILGTILFMFSLGFVFNLFYYKMLKNPNNYIYPLTIIHAYVFLIMTYIISTLMARYMYANIIMITLSYFMVKFFCNTRIINKI